MNVGQYDSAPIVKQCIIFGPKLCSEKINGIGEEIATYITPELTIGVVYVDDILGIGDCKTVENVIRNTRRLEEDKKFRCSRFFFSKYMVIKSGKGKIVVIKESVTEGIIERTD